jgi:catechol 2,3-dioxygenase-like lactoylglutathione lyase family enzyme
MIDSIANIVVPVTDHERAIAFYRDALGFEVRADFTPGPGMRWVELGPIGSATTIALAIPRGGMWGEVGGDTNISLGSSQIVDDHARLRDAGVDVDDEVLVLGPFVPKMFRLRDPDGNILQIVENQAG